MWAEIEKPDWSALNHDLLVEIAKRIRLLEDFINFGRVCKSWGSAANLKKNYAFKHNHMPQLLLAPQKESSEDEQRRDFFNVSKGMSRQVSLPEANDKKTLSSKGWLLTVDRDWGVSLLHPYSRVQIELPNLKSFEDWDDGIADELKHAFFIRKFVLSSSPIEDEDYIVMVIHGGFRKLAYIKPSSKAAAWIILDTSCSGSSVSGFFDVVYYKSKFYAVDNHGRVVVCNFSSCRDNYVVQRVAEMPPGLVGNKILEKLYLVVVSEDVLWVITRGVQMWPIESGGDLYDYGTYGFQVFQVKLSANTWKEINDLGNRTLFLGHNSSFSKVSHISDCKPNCIYFTDDAIESYWPFNGEPERGGKDMGIYNLEDGTFSSYFEGKSLDSLSPPMWVELSFD
ncbi:F-box protein [Melia azedarach]|uniref:F-box protein n=1 Tax=Melia azedarach TaxID=155640 RepID=A0ACC1WP06_MELAZ|nr:F-box protein [Melia azedarach]